MSRKKLKRGVSFSDPTKRYVQLRHYLLKSAAWETLPGDASKLLIDLWARYNGINNGEITYSVREAEHIGLRRSQAARMFAVLCERGFLVVVRTASFTAVKKLSRTWRITDEPYRDEPATKDFMRWRPMSHHSVPPGGPYSPTRGTRTPKSARTVPPVGLSNPVLANSQSHPGDTYNIPGDTQKPTKRETEKKRYLEINGPNFGIENAEARWQRYEELILQKYGGGDLEAAWKLRDKAH
jgi:hypothetical protein